MDELTAALLGAIQGATEFLPVSSSGHVSAAAMLFGLQEMPLQMVILLHFGTLLATLLVMRKDVFFLSTDFLSALRSPRTITQSPSGRVVLGVLLATLPTAVIGLALKDHVESWATVPWVIGACWLFTAAILLIPLFKKTNQVSDSLTHVPWALFFLIGLAQGVAVLPGVSRSGMTIATALLLGLQGKEAFRFSFLISLPAIVGALVLSLGDMQVLTELGSAAWIGALVSFVVGIVCLLWLRQLVEIGKMWIFSVYLAPAGIAFILWDALR